MQLLNFEFKPGWLGIAATLIAVSVFTYLMLWQIGRAEERKQLQHQVMQRSELPIAPLKNTEDVSLSNDRYRRFQVEGHFINQHQVLLDNVVHDGRPGYEVITPFTTTKGESLLINRGWIDTGRDRTVLPEITVTEEPLSLTVMLDKPRSAPVVGLDVVESNNRWNYLDMGFYKKHSGIDIPGYLLLLAADNPSAYTSRWPEIEDKSGMHIGYAIQWGVFALIALGTFLGVNIKRIKQK
ncbi:MAG: SURF1 family protein [Gammaproteobacteria bacterium]|nr:SURF1 family protein [Gammaproteobacteria bacterium]NNJ93066.1 SURF1 family protein [Gammaproteobacteria bacterium]